MNVEIPAAGAGRDGGKGARLDVKLSYRPAWRGRLELGRYVVLLSQVTVSFWARATPAKAGSDKGRRLSEGGGAGSAHQGGSGGSAAGVAVGIDISDESDGGRWLGAAAPVRLGASFSKHSATVVVDPSRSGHTLSFALVVGGTAAEYVIDDVSITQARPPRGMQDGQLTIGFEEGEPPDAASGGLAIVVDSAVPAGSIGEQKTSLAAPLNAMHTTRAGSSSTVWPSGARCARVAVQKAATPAWHIKVVPSHASIPAPPASRSCSLLPAHSFLLSSASAPSAPSTR